MLLRRQRWTAPLAVAFVLGAFGSARAQFGYTYPGGYGGWGGWGASTVLGDEARGMGMFASGVGQYNVQTAQARSINTQTAMMFNEYLWESQQIRNQRYYQQQQAKRNRINMSAEQTYARLRDNPDRDDINSGDALNVALDQITSPKVYLTAMKEAQAKIPSTLIRQVPFNKASEAVTVSIGELTDRNSWPPELRDNPAFEKELSDLRAAADEARKEDDADDLKPETIKRVQAAVAALRAKAEATYPRNSAQRRTVAPYIKGLTGLARMLDTPRYQELLRDVDKHPERSLSDLIGFMHAFNLRFGVAETPDQREAYTQLFPLLDNLRDAVAAEAGPMVVNQPTRGGARRATEFFQGMPDEHLNQSRELPPVPVYRPGQNQAPPAPRREQTKPVTQP
jgi:hypothetical protein